MKELILFQLKKQGEDLQHKSWHIWKPQTLTQREHNTPQQNHGNSHILYWNQMQQTPVNHQIRQSTDQVISSARKMISAALHICIYFIMELRQYLSKQQELWSRSEAQSRKSPKASMSMEKIKEHKVNRGNIPRFQKGEKKTKHWPTMNKQVCQDGRQSMITPLSRKLHKLLLIPSNTSSLPYYDNDAIILLSKWKTNIVCNMQTDNNRQNYRLIHLQRF